MKPSEILAKPQNRQLIIDIIAKYQGENPRYFGSTLRGNDKEGSDLDIVFDAADPLKVNLTDLKHELTAALGIPVDILSSKTVDRHYRETILRHAQPILVSDDVKTMEIAPKSCLPYLSRMREELDNIYQWNAELAENTYTISTRTERMTLSALTYSIQLIGESAERIRKNFPDLVEENPQLAAIAESADHIVASLLDEYELTGFDELQQVVEQGLPELENQLIKFLSGN